MKREKITFAFLILPFFLFSASFEHFRLDISKKQNPFLIPQQVKTSNEGKLFQSKGILHAPEQVTVIPKPSLSKYTQEARTKVHQPTKFEKIQQDNSGFSRHNRGKKRNPSFSQRQTLNKLKPFRYSGPPYRPDQVLVKFKPTLSEQMREVIIAAYQTKQIKRIPRLNIYQLQIPERTSVEEMLYVLRRNPDIEYAEPNYMAYITVTPNDTLFNEQYALYNWGQELGPPGSPQGKERADIKAREAWEETKGDEDIIIAIIDSGVDFDHPDLEDKILSSGYDFVNDDSDATDDLFHGTHVAGIAAAETNNNEGIAGVAWNCKILPVKVIDATGWGDYADVIDGIRWAADFDPDYDDIPDVDVINLSVGGDFPSQLLENALKYAYDKNIVIVASAGNDGGAVLYPAAYDDYCLAVAGTDYNDERVTFSTSGGFWESNHGPEIDIAAPGERIASCVPTWFYGPGSFPYAYGGGTSMAAPHVAGLAALIKSIKSFLTAKDIMNVIRYTADDVNSESNPGKDEYIGYGRINMEKALVPIKITSSKRVHQ